MEKKESEKIDAKVMYGLICLSNILHRFFNNETAQDDLEIIESWRPEESPISYSATADEIEAGCDRVKKEVFSALDIRPGVKEHNLKRKKMLRINIIRKYAAIAIPFIMLLSAGWYIWDSKMGNILTQTSEAHSLYTYYETDDSEMKSVELIDGSVLHLNGGTKLRVIKGEFNKEKREIWLENGEVFFEVTKNKKKPFIIHSGKLKTIVRGTSFNIKSYNELDESVVSVRSGRVEIRKDGQMLGLFVKNTQLTYNHENGQYTAENSAWEDAAAWMDGDLVFHNADRNELSLRLRQKYGVMMECAGKALIHTKLNARFKKNTRLKDLLNNVCTLYGLKYKITDKSVNIYR